MINNYSELLEKLESYIDSKAEIDSINQVYYFSKKTHEGQYRKSGEQYIIHPINVAKILADLEMPPSVIKSALLHDVIEDCDLTYDDIKEKFGTVVADIVDGVTKIGNLPFDTASEAKSANHYKLLLAMSKDIRVIIVKLADRLHNLQTLEYMSPEKQKTIANETLEIYAPLAHRIGMYHLKWQLEDLSFKYINNKLYRQIAEQIKLKKANRDTFVSVITNEIQSQLEKNNIDAKIYGRSKTIYSIYKKMQNKNRRFDEIYDLFAFRIVVTTINECYSVLGVLHNNYRPIPNRFKDYIPTPKNNTYQSIHTAVLSKQGIPIEFQIRTKEMDHVAEYGLAAHWAYKEDADEEQIHDEISKKLSWLKERIDEGNQVGNSREVLDNIKSEVFTKNIFVYTPKGKIVELPQNSKAIDFAYYIHTDIGNHAISAKINGEKIVSLFYKLRIGDVVQIITSNAAMPEKDWFHKATTQRAKSAIKDFFKDQLHLEIMERGESNFKNLLKTHSNYEELMTLFMSDDFYVIIEENSYVSRSKIFEMIALGEIDPQIIINHLNDFLMNKTSTKLNVLKEVHIIDDDYNDDIIFDYDIRIARCCNPLPGETIVGVKNAFNDELTYDIHLANCAVASKQKRERAAWTDYAEKNMHTLAIKVVFVDQVGALARIVNVISKEKVNIISLFTSVQDEYGVLNVKIEVNNYKKFLKLVQKLRKNNFIIRVERDHGN